MKLLISILAFTFPIIASGQTFLNKYFSSLHNEIYSVVETTNGDYILSGYSERDDSTPGGYLLKIDNYGVTIGEFTDTIEEESSYGRILKVSPDHFLLTQTINSYPHNQIKLWNLNPDLILSEELTYTFSDSLKYDVDEFLAINDSIYCMLLSKRIDSKVDFALLNINLNDSSFFYYSPDIFKYRIPTGMIYDSVSQLLKVSALGYSIKEDGSNKVFTFDPQLVLLSIYSNNSAISGQLQITSMNDTTYLLSGSFINPVPGDTRRLHTLLLDSDDIILDSITLNYGYDTVTYPGFGHGMLATDSCIWVIGMYDITPEYFPYSIHPSWIQLSQLDFELNILKQYYYGGDGNYASMDIINTSDNGLLITGSYFNNTANPLLFQLDPFVLKTNSQGIIVSSSNQDFPYLQQAIISPNPGKQFLTVKLAVQIDRASLQVYDLKGQLVLTEDIIDEDYKIDISSLKDGTYIYKVISNNQIIGTGKWIKI